MNDIAPIRDEATYTKALAEVRQLWGTEPGTVAGDRLEVLMVLVDAYEAERHQIAPPDPIEAIRIRMEEMGLSRTDLGAILGVASGRVSEILNRRRRLTIDIVRTLAAKLKLPEDCLLQPYELVSRTPHAPGFARRRARR